MKQWLCSKVWCLNCTNVTLCKCATKWGIVDVFVTNLMDAQQKAKIVADFTNPDGYIHVVIAAVALEWDLTLQI